MSVVPPKNPTTQLLHSKPATATKEELSLRNFSDEVVTGHIYTKHRDDDKTKIDVDNYISLVESIITVADRISESATRGVEGHAVFSDDTLKSSVSVDPPLCTLHKISSELSCKAPGIEKAHQTTLVILDILISYPWEAKAVLALTAFVTEYGDIWHLNHYSHHDPLAKALALIKRGASLKKHLDSLKYRQVLLSPTSLIYSCLKAIKHMNKIREFSKYDIKELTELSSAVRQIPLITYWIIHIIVASRTEVSSYLNDTEGQPQRYLTELAEKINSIINILENQLSVIRGQQEEIDLYRWLVDHIENFPTEIPLVVSKLVEGKIHSKPFFDGSTLTEVSVESSLADKNVILVISGLDISNEDIKALHLVHSEVKKEDKYKIVWIPIIPEYATEEERKKYDYIKSTTKWYTIQYTTKVAGLRFLEEQWQLREDPLVVVLNSKSKVEFTNAIHLIRVWGTDAIPFTRNRADILLRKNWPESTIIKFTDHPRLRSWINQERSILFYGGKDPKWIQNFEEKVVDIKSDPLMRDKGITFEIVRIGKNFQGEDDPILMSRFWLTQWGYFIVKSQVKGSSASETTEDILRLISYQNENGWAVLAVGSAPLLVGRGNLVLAVMEEFNKWKSNLNIKGFPDSFTDYFNDLALKTHQCERVTLPGFSGWIPMVVNCPECPRFMETGISFKCCHGHTHM
ncbi:protein SIEVE ELEMENT OCCLUSION B-like [Momordica charantia]|uniref:Protein SIEVE ELEMENT OCCLUSION B-like n=1 Tax=Momordica charantia TaxID=3673 RepID=A0A6J1C993_MOMCH|nr:protein SIEVE ELEMENT OCCLUSION B-like [Momordica charantia]